MKGALFLLCVSLATLATAWLGASGCRDRSSSAGPTARGDEDHPLGVGDPFLERPDAGPAAATDASSEASSESAAATTKTVVRLLDPGESPRRTLRYAWRRDRKETLTIDLRTTAATESDDQHPPDVPLPAVRIVIGIEPRDVTSAGTLLDRWAVASTQVTPAPGSNPELADGMNAEVAAIKHLVGTREVTARGLANDVSIDGTSVGDVRDAGATGEMVEQVRQTLFDLETPLPEEAVGRGARWEKIARLASRSVVVTQSETFTLASIAGDRGTVDDVLAQTAPPQAWPTPGAGGSDPTRVDSMLATGTVRSRFDLTRIVPFTTYAGTTTMVLSGTGGGHAARRVTMMLKVDITLSGSMP